MIITYYNAARTQEGPFLAEFGLKIPKWDITFIGLKLIRGLNGSLFVCPPSKEYKSDSGKKEYKDYWYFGKETSVRFREEALKALKAYVKEKHSIELS